MGVDGYELYSRETCSVKIKHAEKSVSKNDTQLVHWPQGRSVTRIDTHSPE